MHLWLDLANRLRFGFIWIWSIQKTPIHIPDVKSNWINWTWPANLLIFFWLTWLFLTSQIWVNLDGLNMKKNIISTKFIIKHITNLSSHMPVCCKSSSYKLHNLNKCNKICYHTITSPVYNFCSYYFISSINFNATNKQIQSQTLISILKLQDPINVHKKERERIVILNPELQSYSNNSHSAPSPYFLALA